MARDNEIPALTPALMAAPLVLAQGKGQSLAKVRHGGLAVEVSMGQGALWVVLRRPEGQGGLALRFPVFGTDASARVLPADGALAHVE